jgi:thiol-disulfide isomerase/thioredoxin
MTMLSRRTLVSAAIVGTTMAASAGFAVSALATETRTFDQKAFAEAQKAGKPIFVGVHASWCPTCKAQDPILGELMSTPKFKDLVYFVIDFDGQKDAVKAFGVRTQSTLIAFKGDKETGRSVGDTNRASIGALLDKTL